MLWRHEERWLFRSPFVSIGLLDVPPGAEAWHRPCVTSGPVQIAFPSRAIRTVVEGLPSEVGDRVITPLEAMLAEGEWVYRRHTVDPRGERSAVFQFADAAVRSAVAVHNPAGAAGDGPAFDVGVAGVGPAVYARQRRLVRRLLGAEPIDPLAVEEEAAAVLRATTAHAARLPTGRVRSGRAHASTRDAHAEAVREAMVYLERCAHERVGLDDVGRAAHMSPAHFARVFKARTGLTVAAALMQVRLRRALGDVLDSQDPLWRIASRHGFADSAHLSNTFRRAFGAVPSVIRRTA